MSERIENGYKRLCEVQLLHHYWLDDGSAIYDSLSENRKSKLGQHYDVGDFMTIIPTTSTKNRLMGFGGVFKNTSLGFIVAIPKSTIIPDDEVFSFILIITDAAFYNYTALTFITRKIYDLYYLPEKRTYRYKENVPVFSNLTGVSRGIAPHKTLFLSKEIPGPAGTDKAEFLNISGGALVQLTGSQPGATIIQLNADASKMPVFFHQNDTPAIIPPPGLTGVPRNGILLNDNIADNVFAMIDIAATNPSDMDYSCTTGGVAKETCPVFQVRFKNRSAAWRYFNKNSGAFILETDPLPLTFNGNAKGDMKKPGESIIKVQFDGVDPAKRIEKIYTEIYE